MTINGIEYSAAQLMLLALRPPARRRVYARQRRIAKTFLKGASNK